MKPQYLVVDTAALVTHIPLWEYGETLCSVPEVIAEIRDKEARRRLEALPFPITMRQPLPQSIKFVNEFSKKTGDYASLSLADIKILALTYELEVEVQESADHLNKEPRKIITEGATTKASRRQRKDPEEFNDPPEECDGGQGSWTSSTSLRDAAEAPPSFAEQHLKRLNSFLLHHSYVSGYILSRADINLHKALMRQYPQFWTTFEGLNKCQATSASFHNASHSPCPHTLPHVMRWAVHIASITEAEEASLPISDQTVEDLLGLMDKLKGEKSMSEDADTDHQAISCPEDTEATERKENDMTQDPEGEPSEISTGDNTMIDAGNEEDGVKESEEEAEEEESVNEREEEEEAENHEEEQDEDDDDGWITCKNIKRHKARKNFFNAPEEEEEEEKDVKVACITGDFAVQNVLKHIGLSVMGVDGKLIKRLKTYILRCYACFKTTSVMEKIFCPHCGNKTLKKVSVTLDPDGTQRIWINTKKPINKKGMKYSLPVPKGGKHGRNPILVEDQREAKRFSSKMSKKKLNPLHDDYNPDQMPFAVRDVYSRAAQLGYIGGKNHYHFYWERRNPNEPLKRTGKK